MREENNVSKNGWKRIFRKKWFFPAVYLTMAALLLTGVLWYQNLGNQIPEASEEPQTEMDSDSYSAPFENKESAPVVDQQEVVQMPVESAAETKIVTKFYDYDAEAEEQEQALVLYNNKYYQSKGIDIASADGKTFNVTASLSGTITEVKEDPLLGNVVKISHENDVSTYYASLADVKVEEGAEVEQGDILGTAGQNLFGQAAGIHVHFEVRKGETALNPEDYFNQPVSKIKVEETSSVSSESDNTESTEESTESTKETKEQSTTDSNEPNAEEPVPGEGENPEEGQPEEEQPEEDPESDETNPGEDSNTNSESSEMESSAAMAQA